MRELIKNGLLRNLYNHWCDCRSSHVVPFRSSIDLTRIPDVFSHLAIFEFIPQEETYVCRLAGDIVQKTYKKSLAGKNIDEIFSNEISALLSSYFDTVRNHTSVASGKAVSLDEKRVELILLPLANVEGEIVQILSAQVCDYDIEQTAFDFAADDFIFRSFECRNIED
ncbi:PAS domain-containing protein [Curvivirga aplysinae]|uniref:PAS domain-containing protein n=1 Tax=Curvivirga aplysinae TaxID=2529852 RepID=UPI001C3F6B0B|nr:PAS domain-containing protein [Curvivirga aplysinae]